MANALGTLTADLVALKVLKAIKKQFPVFSAVATDLGDGQVDFNQQVVARVATVPTVQDYHVDNGYVAGDATTTDVPVTIDNHKHVSMKFNTNEMTGTKRNLVQEQVETAAYALGAEAAAALFGVATVANFPNETVQTVPNSDRELLTAARKALNGRGAPTMGRYAVVNSDVFETLSNDSRLISKDYDGGEIDYTAGRIRNVAGFSEILEYPDLPANGENMTGFAGAKASLVFAARVPKDPALLIPNLNIPGKIEVFTDPDTGLSLMARHHYDMQKGSLQMTLVWMYGVAKGVANHGQRLASVAN